MRQRVSQEGHRAQHDVAPQYRTGHTHDDRGDQGLLHEEQGERLGKPADHLAPPGVPGRPHGPVPTAALVDHDDLPVDDDHLTPEGLVQMSLGEHDFRASRADETTVQQHHLIETAGSEVQDRGWIPAPSHPRAQPRQQLQGGFPRSRVDPCERLVEEQHTRLLSQCPRQERPLLLPARQLPDGALSKIPRCPIAPGS